MNQLVLRARYVLAPVLLSLLSADASAEDMMQVIVKGERPAQMHTTVYAIPILSGLTSVNGGGGGSGGTTAQTTEKNKDKDCKESASPKTGNPVIIATGEKFKDELDFASDGLYGFSLQRTYRSLQTAGSLFGPNWMSTLEVPKMKIPGTCVTTFDAPRYTQV